MEDDVNELESALDKWAQKLKRSCIITDGTITDVDEDLFTCQISVEDAVYDSVPLKTIINAQASFIEIPKIGTDCLIAFKHNNIHCPMLMSVSECDKILIKVGESTLNITDGLFQFNGGNNGFVESDKLTTKINAIENKINDIILKMQTSFIPCLNPAQAVAILSAFNGSIATETQIIPITTQADISSTKIKQE